jgi:16S rRNA G1207 methylase RsmC
VRHTGRGGPTVTAELLGRAFRFAAAPGLFSAERVDDGTRLILGHLPSSAPKRVLDLGCGYGALGLPVASSHPSAALLLVDRDALAVEYAGRNARSHGLSNVHTATSLGYRDVPESPFDWVLCNVPARIGEPAIRYFLGEGARRLAAGGELRVVVISDLCATVQRIARDRGWALLRCARGERHEVFALGPLRGEPLSESDHESVYARDNVKIGALTLTRPSDFSEDGAHHELGVALFLEMLPRSLKGDALVWRGGYGAVALTLAQRGAHVVACDRDLLATTFTRRNAAQHGVAVGTREGASLEKSLPVGCHFDFAAMEVHPGVSEDAAKEDVLFALASLRQGGLFIFMGLTGKGKKLQKLLHESGVRTAVLGSRGPYTVWRAFGVGP